VQLVHEVPTQCSVLWLSPDAPTAALSVLSDLVTPTLVIVDYAESRADQLRTLLRALITLPLRRQVKVLLLARTAGAWWDQLRQSSDDVGDLLATAVTWQLEPMAADTADRGNSYRDALGAFARCMPDVPGMRSHPWQSIADSLPTPPHMAAGALTLHMTALADLLDAATPTGLDHTPKATAEDRVLDHELHYWNAAAVAQGLVPSFSTILHDTVAAMILTGPSTHDEAHTILRRLPALTDQPQVTLDRLIRWLATLFPHAGNRPFDTLQPDRLAERFLGHHITKATQLTTWVAGDATRSQAEHLLTVHTRAAALPGFTNTLDESLTALCISLPDSLAVAAVTIATQVERPDPLLAALHTITTDPATPITTFTALRQRAAEEVAALRAAHAAELEQFRAAAAEQLQAAQADAERRLATAREQAHSEIETARARFAEQLTAAETERVRAQAAATRAEQAARLTALRRELDEAVDAERQRADATVEALRTKLAREIDGLNRVLEALRSNREQAAAVPAAEASDTPASAAPTIRRARKDQPR
jgi:hypothetical protein